MQFWLDVVHSLQQPADDLLLVLRHIIANLSQLLIPLLVHLLLEVVLRAVVVLLLLIELLLPLFAVFLYLDACLLLGLL